MLVILVLRLCSLRLKPTLPIYRLVSLREDFPSRSIQLLCLPDEWEVGSPLAFIYA